MTMLSRYYMPDFGRSLTSHDVMKSIALIFMVVDHLGAFFFPQVQEWRMVGRLSAPIWLFLAGYADTRVIPPRFIVGALLLVVANLVAGGPIFPLNIIVAIIAVRWAIDRLVETSLVGPQELFQFFVVLAVLAFPLNILFDYGSFAFFFALYGYMVRHPLRHGISRSVCGLYAAGLVVFYAAYESFIFRFDMHETALVMLGVGGILFILSFFRAYQFPNTATGAMHILTAPLRWGGRYTLEFYVVHLALFRCLATYLHTSETTWFHPSLFPWG